MSKLNELIQELCPDGVEYKQLQDILKIKNGNDYKKFSEGDIPVYGSGGIIAYTSKAAFDKPSVLIPRKGSIDKLYYVDTPFWNVDTIFYTDINTDVVMPRYIYHCLKKEHLESLNTAGGVPSLTQTVLNKVVVPVPPLEIQQEVVRILDSFTELTAELTAELTTELTARKQQFEHYRDAIFSGGNYVTKPIYEIAETNIGVATTVTKHKSKEGVLLIHNSDIQENKIKLKSHEYITEEFASENNNKCLKTGDIITVRTGDAGTSAVISKEYNGAIGFTTITSRIKSYSEVLPEYLCHYLNSHRCKQDIARMTISDRSNLNQKNFNKLLIPIPDIKEQDHIISILNNFNNLCGDLFSGLPAEIEARQKQYEYYRDMLLTFKEKMA